MGVVYKLTPNISSFIVEQKQVNPKVSCQSIADKVYSTFGQRVSKSSVHELLKQTHVITPRTRVIKEKFQIPQEKKTQISQALGEMFFLVDPAKIEPVVELPKSIALPEPKIESLPAVIPLAAQEPEIIEAPPLPTPIEAEITFAPVAQAQVPAADLDWGKADIFLKCALWDLSMKPILGLKDFSDIATLTNNKIRVEWEYLTQEVRAVKIELEDGQSFYVDSRFQGLYAEHPKQEFVWATIERVACEIADYVLNNIAPLVIQEYAVSDLDSVFYDLISGLENLKGKNIKKAYLLDVKGQNVADFNLPIGFKRRFILGISSQVNDFQWVKNQEKREVVWETPLKDRFGRAIILRILKTDDKFIVTNLDSMSYEEIVQEYTDRFLSAHHAQLLLSDHAKKEMTTPNLWLLDQLKERARLFFPSMVIPADLEEILNVPAAETSQDRFCYVYLKPPADFIHQDSLQAAVSNLNNLYIRNYQGKIVRISILNP